MKRIYFLIISITTYGMSYGQNLVPNGNFEQYTSCPTGQGQIDSALFWLNPSSGTPDYFNQCSTYFGVPNNPFGYQQAFDGIGYAGLYTWTNFLNVREYIETPLTTPLITDSCYRFEMRVNLCNLCGYTSNTIGVYFSDTLVDGIMPWSPLNFVPQVVITAANNFDTLSWTLVTGDYIAHGGEAFLIIGNYYNDITTNVTILDTINSLSTMYYLIDNVSLNKISTCNTGAADNNEKGVVNIYPNPFCDKLMISNAGYELSEAVIYDLTSKILIHRNFVNAISLNTENLVPGIYFYEVRNMHGIVQKGKIVKN